jgi:hypothetical protein
MSARVIIYNSVVKENPLMRKSYQYTLIPLPDVSHRSIILHKANSCFACLIITHLMLGIMISSTRCNITHQ